MFTIKIFCIKKTITVRVAQSTPSQTTVAESIITIATTISTTAKLWFTITPLIDVSHSSFYALYFHIVIFTYFFLFVPNFNRAYLNPIVVNIANLCLCVPRFNHLHLLVPNFASIPNCIPLLGCQKNLIWIISTITTS